VFLDKLTKEEKIIVDNYKKTIKAKKGKIQGEMYPPILDFMKTFSESPEKWEYFKSTNFFDSGEDVSTSSKNIIQEAEQSGGPGRPRHLSVDNPDHLYNVFIGSLSLTGENALTMDYMKSKINKGDWEELGFIVRDWENANMLKYNRQEKKYQILERYPGEK
jgi:hypothetical protein